MDWHLSVIFMIIFLGLSLHFRFSRWGGGLISTPALLAVGLPPSVALGKINSQVFSTLTSAYKFYAQVKDLKVVGKLFPFVFIASGGGAILATYTCRGFKATHYRHFNTCDYLYRFKRLG